MEEWKSYKLCEICDLIPGFAFKSADFGDYSTKAIKIGDIQPPYVNRASMSGVNIEVYDKNKLSKFLVKRGDFVLAMTGATIGKIGRYIDQEPAYLNQRVLLFRPNGDVNPKFVYYSLLSPLFQQYVINHIDSETAQPNISGRSVSGYEIALPSRKEQDRIALILSTIDDKIELNTRINHNLDEQAQALYKFWFVDFVPFKGEKFVDSELGMIPEGWHVGTLSEIADITMGQSPSGASFNEDGHGIVFYQGRTEFGFRFPSIKLFTTEPSRFADPHSVLMSVRAPVGDINVALKKCCIGRGLAAITAKDDAFSFVLYTLKGKSSELDLYNGEGTVFGSINRKDLEGLSVLIPPKSIIQRFNECIRPIDDSIEIACKEIVSLSYSRDSLLPKLMSGQLTFDEFDC